MEAVKHIPLEDREAFKYALAATLVKNHAHWRAFETVFEVYFSLGLAVRHRRGRGRPGPALEDLEGASEQERWGEGRAAAGAAASHDARGDRRDALQGAAAGTTRR